MDESLSSYFPKVRDPTHPVLRCADTYKKLESSIFNSVSLGQWESARACFKCLSQSDDTSTCDTARELLKILTLEANNFWKESVAIPSPHHLSWLALGAFRSFFPDDKESLPDYIEKLIEFRLLLYQSRGIISFSTKVANTLCYYHSTHVLQVPGTTFDTVPHLSDLIISFLRDVVTILDPALGHTLITSLMVTSYSSQYISNNESLQFIYLDCIDECLEALQTLCTANGRESDLDSQYKSNMSGVEFTGSECEKAVNMVYILLSLMNGTPEMTRLMKKVDTIFHTLLQGSYSVGTGPPVTFEVGRIYACLLGRSNTFLINRLHEVEEFLRLNKITEDSHHLKLSPGNKPIYAHDTKDEDVDRTDDPSDIKYELARVEWRNRFYDAVYTHKHILESVLNRGLQLIHTGKLQDLSKLMMQAEFVPLRPVLLLLGWDRCAAMGSGKELLDSLWPMEVSTNQPLMFNGCCKLAFQVELVQWCLDKAQPHIQSPLTLTFHRAGDMFKGLKSHSTLYVLHHSTPLASLDPFEVINILKMRPRTPSRSSLVSPPPQFSRGVTPLKQEVSSEVEISPAPSPMVGTPHRLFSAIKQTTLKPEQERDIAIFKGFSVLKLVINAIWSSVLLRNGIMPSTTKESSEGGTAASVESIDTVEQFMDKSESSAKKRQTGSSKAARKLELGSEIIETTLKEENIADLLADEDSTQQLLNNHYQTEITDRLQEAMLYLGNIFPLNFRLEILENMFSLLLVTSDDIRQMKGGGGGGVGENESFMRAFLGSAKSGNISSFVTLVKSRREFLVDEQVASELLDVLQDCICELRAAKYALTQQSDSLSTEEDTSILPPNAVKSSVSDVSLKSRTTRLEQYINEARWRLQMVSSKHGVTSSPSIFVPSEFSSSEVSDFSDSEGEGLSTKKEEVATKRETKRRHKKTSHVHPPEVKDDGSGSVSSLSSSKADSVFRPASSASHTSSNGRPPVTNVPAPLSSNSSSSTSPWPVGLGAGCFARGPLIAKKSVSKQSLMSSVGSRVITDAASDFILQRKSCLDEDSGDCANVEERSTKVNTSKRRKYSKSRNSQLASFKRHLQMPEHSDPKSSRNNIICRMLASPGSLLRLCLKHSNYMRASEVLKTLHMEGQFGKALIHFSEQYDSVSKELTEHSCTKTSMVKSSPTSTSSSSSSHPHSTHLSSSTTPPPHSYSGGLGSDLNHQTPSPNINLQVAIMNARSSFDPLQSVYQLLAPSSVYQILFSGDPGLERLAQESEVLRRLMKHVPSLVMLDMVCSSKINGQIAEKILEAASDRLQSDLSKFQDMNGPFVLLKLMSEVSGHFPQSLGFPIHQSLVLSPYTSPHYLLTRSTHVLTPETISRVRLFMDTYREAREKLENEMNSSKSKILSSSKNRDFFSLLAEQVSSSDSPTSSPLRKQTPSNGSIFNEVIRVIHSVLPEAIEEKSPVLPGSMLESGILMEKRNAVSFLWQFSRYLGKLIELFVKCLEMKSSKLNKGSLVLLVLQESPSRALGHLIFAKGIHPEKLESLMGDFTHLQLVECLIKCCCPHIPSMVANSLRKAISTPSIVALNRGKIHEMADPSEMSFKLLNKLINILKSLSAQSFQQEPVLFPSDLARAYKNTDIQKILSETPSLASVDLSVLSSLTNRTIFYTNILNLLYLHSLMYYFANAASASRSDVVSLELNEILCCGISPVMIQSNRLLQTALFTKMGYFIGQLGLISCYDLHYTLLLRRGPNPPRDAGLQPRLSLVESDPWLNYAPTNHDPRIIYVIHNGSMESPYPVPLNRENFESSLSSAERQYLNSKVSIDVDKRVVYVPKSLSDNRNSLVSSSESSSVSSNLHQSDMSLVKYIQSKMEVKTGDILLTLIEASESAKNKRLNLSVQQESAKLGYDLRVQLVGVVSPRGSPKERRKRLSQELSTREKDLLSPISGDLFHLGHSTTRNSFTTETFEFVKKRAPLLAGLIVLSCPIIQSSSRKSPESKSSAQVDDNGSLTPWQKCYNDILTHFSSSVPMKNFLETRLTCFAELFQWDVRSDGVSSLGITPSDPSNTTLRKLSTAPTSSNELGMACVLAMNMLMEAGRIREAVGFLNSEPAINHLPDVRFLADLVLSSSFVSNYQDTHTLGESRDDAKDKILVSNSLPILSQISDLELATRLALALLPNRPVDTCVDILSYCLHHLPNSSTLITPLTQKLERMRVYARIMSRCSILWKSATSPWKNWNDLAEDSQKKSNYVLRNLLKNRQFELAREWHAVHKLSDNVSRQIEMEYLFDLLEGTAPNPILAHQKLDNLPDSRTSLDVCEALLNEKKKKTVCENAEVTEADLKTIIFVLQYMLTRLSVSIANRPEYCNRLLGAKALLCLPQSAYKLYKHLLQHPLLLVEQLIMDLKIDWAASVIRQLRSNKLLHSINTSDTPVLDHTPMVEDEGGGEEEEEGISRDPFSTLLMFYCNKALDFPIPVLIQSTPAQSLIQSISGTQPPSPTPYQSSNRHTQPQTPATKLAVGVPPEDYCQYPPMTPRRPSFKSRSSFTMPTTTFNESAGQVDFHPPTDPPPRERWEKDNETKTCRICNAHFGMFMRRHHCRQCGRVVCAKCSSNMNPVTGYDRLVRVCDTCHQFFSRGSSQNAPDRFDGTIALIGSTQDHTYPTNTLPLTHFYKLIPNDLMYNAKTRLEFYYERTPNTALCLSLADLLVDKRQTAGVILDCCHTVSAQLVPDTQGRVNEEVDHHFVIGLIQNLLLNAKLRFAEAGDSSGVELCDTYLSRVDILRLFVSSRYNKIPSIQELTKQDLAKRVRDRLIQDDRFGLAMEVSTKCQLDASAVWIAWGMAYLKSGDFQKARSKLRHCFQVSSQRGSGGQNANLLKRIIDQIEQRPLSAIDKWTRISEDWSKMLVDAMAVTQQRISEEWFGECIYYLHTYGSHSSSVAFFVKHSCLKKACMFLLDNNCSSDVFVEHFWVPVLKSGQVEMAVNNMRELDPSMFVWQQYLTAACRFFSNKSLYSVLLKTQLYMNDYVRAGLTCIKFFIGFAGRSTTIADLYGRQHYLTQAYQHFQTSLDNKTRLADRGWSMRSRTMWYEGSNTGNIGSAIKSMTTSELKSHLDTILLQKRVVDHLYQSARVLRTVCDPLSGTEFKSHADSRSLSSQTSSSSSPSSSTSSSNQQPATLFSNSHARREVAAQVMVYSHDLAEGFYIARDIIEIYKLNSKHVFCDTARGLALKQRYGDIRILIKYIQDTHQGKAYLDSLNDEIVMAAIKVLASHSKQMKQVDRLVDLLTNERSKIKGLVQCGKLKSAYLIAIKARLVDEVQNISEIASKAGQLPIRDICEKWLLSNAPHRQEN